MATFTKRANIRWHVTLDAEPALSRQIEEHWRSKPDSAPERAPLQRGVFKGERSAVEHAGLLRDSLAREGFGLAKERVQKAESGAWQVRIHRAGAADLTKTFARKADAEQWAREREGQIAKRAFVDYALAALLVEPYRHREIAAKPRDPGPQQVLTGIAALMDGPHRRQVGQDPRRTEQGEAPGQHGQVVRRCPLLHPPHGTGMPTVRTEAD